MEPWSPIDAAQLKERTPVLSPDAPAEVLDWTIEVDDRARPEDNVVHEYIRYKIFDPEKATKITRVSEVGYSYEGSLYNDVEIRARLTLPDGTRREFGKESIQERDLQRNGGEKTWVTRLFGSGDLEVKEKFLATGGIEPGSILEFQFLTKQRHPGNYYSFVLQKEGIPVRKVEFKQFLADGDAFTPHPSLLNGGNFVVKESADLKNKAVVIRAENLPGYSNEPFQAPLYDRTLTYLGSYRPHNLYLITNRPFTAKHFDAKAGPWTGYATMCSIFEQDVTVATKPIRRLAASITAGATSDLDRARRIHRYVHGLCMESLRSRKNSKVTYNVVTPMAEDVAEYEKHPDEAFPPLSFLYLAVALYRAAGLETQVLLLPNNGVAWFSPTLTSDVFLPEACARLRVGGAWMYSIPQVTAPVPFGSLPWQNRGGVALVAQSEKAEFVDVPGAPASDSTTENSGTLRLGADGGLEGDCRRILTGEPATALRALLWEENPEGIRRRIGEQLGEEFKADSAEVASVEGFDDPAAPVSISYRLHWSDYAEVTRERIIFRPLVFHGLNQSPFVDGARHGPVVFPFKWTEADTYTLDLPQGYVFESPSEPPSEPGDRLNYVIAISYAAKVHRLYIKRSFMCNAVEFPVDAYPKVKTWFDAMAQSDGHELVLVKAPHAETPSPPPAGATHS